MPERGSRRMTGGRYEQLAAAYLQTQGLQTLEQNYRCRSGEIDLIMRDGRYLVFVEVKYRRTESRGYPEEAVDARKQDRIRRTARYYLYTCHYPAETACRFDVVSILGDRIRWIKDAF